MTELRHRAERAVLGALITDPGSTGYTGLTTDDFDDRRHQVIFTALAGPSQQSGGLLRRLRDWLANFRQRGELGELSAYVDKLPDACPDPGHLRSYVQMLTASRPEPVASAGDASVTLAQAASTLTGTVGASPGDPGEDVERLARALRGRAPSLNPGRDPQPRQDSTARPTTSGHPLPAARQISEPAATVSSAAATAGSSAVSDETAGPSAPKQVSDTRPMTREDLEGLVLADLLNHPADVRDVISWLPVTAFTPGPRQQLYELAASMIAENYPVDPLIVAWEAEQFRAGGAPGSLDGAFVLRTGALDTPRGAAAELGRMLLSDRSCVNRFGAGWHTGPMEPDGDQPVSADLISGEEPDQSPVPAASVQEEPGPLPASAAGQASPSSAQGDWFTQLATARPGPEPAAASLVLAPPPVPAFREPVPEP